MKRTVGDGPAATSIGRNAYEEAMAMGLQAAAAVTRAGRELALAGFEELGVAALPGFAYWIHGYVFQLLTSSGWPNSSYRVGDVIGALALTEATGGSDIKNICTSVTEMGDGYVIKGEKRFISLGSIADVMIVSGKLRDGSVSLFLIEANLPGVRRTHVRTDYAMRGLDLCDVVLDEVYCPRASCVALEATIPLLRALTLERFIAAVVAGAMTLTVLERVRSDLLRRRSDGMALREFQALRLAYGDAAMRTRSVAALLDVQKARFLDEERLDPADIAECKYEATEALRTTATLLVSISGARGVTGDAIPLRLLADAFAQCTYGGTSNVMREVAAARAMARS